ncbi:MAG: hypothetical protein GY850_06970 [bacterium]|nr:hypothetical protein [bacterium]
MPKPDKPRMIGTGRQREVKILCHEETKAQRKTFTEHKLEYLTAGEPVITQKDFDVFGFFFLAVRHNQVYPGTQIQLTID